MRNKTLSLFFAVCCFSIEAGTSFGATQASVESRVVSQKINI
jgi:hypothetical protein